MLTAAEWEILALSAQVASWATLLGLPPAIALGWLLARRRFRGKGLLEALLQLPMVLPPVVPGYLLLLVLGTQAPLGRWLQEYTGWVFAFDFKGAVLVAALMAFPLLLQPIRLAFRMQDPRLLQVATTLGATPTVAFWTVALPLAIPAILAGMALCFCRALGEFGATMAFVGSIPGETRTLALAIYGYLQQPGGEAAATRLTVLAVLLALLALGLSQWLTRRAERQLGYDPVRD